LKRHSAVELLHITTDWLVLHPDAERYSGTRR